MKKFDADRAYWDGNLGALFTELNSSQSGIELAEAASRLISYGLNSIPDAPQRPAWRLFVAQFQSALTLLLFGASALSFAIGDVKDALAIAVVVLINACVGFYQEFRAERSLHALRSMLAQKSKVKRGSAIIEIDASQIVPGDILLVEAGDKIAADGRWILAINLEVQESVLTGESLPVEKNAATCSAAAALGDRLNCGFMNTVVTRGRGELLVVATGVNTEIGKIGKLIAEGTEPPTPLQLQLNSLGKTLAAIAIGVVLLIAAIGLLRGDDFYAVLVSAIALAVAAIPEGLPAVVTVTLAIGMFRMAKSRAIVKRLAAVETLGCTTVICSDKTGTLTMNQMTATELVVDGNHYRVSGLGYSSIGEISPVNGGSSLSLDQVFMPMLLCNDSDVRDDQLVGDPTEGALLVLARKAGLNADVLRSAHPRIGEVPFDSAVKLMATCHDANGAACVYVKGAPDVLLARATSVLRASGVVEMDDQEHAWWEKCNNEMAQRGLRVLALGVMNFADHAALPMRHEDLKSITLVGLVGIVDPPRDEARNAIALCRGAGVAVKMITGDHPSTAYAIATQLGLRGDVVTGAELDGMQDAELAMRVEQIVVFARVSPMHKVRIVAALRGRGHVVAMTGDGVNDAAAMKRADIGIAMGITGTSVTKDAATMVLTDDNFATIVEAVREGRGIYENIAKFIRFQLATNIGAVFTVLSASLMGLPAPFSPVQILWINIIMDGPPALTLGIDPVRNGVMLEPPRAREARVLDRNRLLPLFLQAVIMAAGTLGVYALGMEWYDDSEHALTMAFTTFVLFQFFNVFNARSGTRTAISKESFTNAKLWIALAGVLVLQVAAVQWSFANGVFDTVPMTGVDWVIALSVASSVLALEEMRKRYLRRGS